MQPTLLYALLAAGSALAAPHTGHEHLHRRHPRGGACKARKPQYPSNPQPGVPGAGYVETYPAAPSPSPVEPTTVATNYPTAAPPAPAPTTATTGYPVAPSPVQPTTTAVDSPSPPPVALPSPSEPAPAPAPQPSQPAQGGGGGGGYPTSGQGGSISVTPHDKYSSSIGVLGCKINTNRVAYWPSSPGCNDICVKVTANGRSVHLLKIDQSGGAHDISYDAWNYLNCGSGAAEKPTSGGGIPATYETVAPSECADLITEPEGKLAFSAANSMNFINSCPAGSWVHDNLAIYNIANSACTYGVDEKCTMPDLAAGFNQATCPHQLGIQTPLTTCPVKDIQYQTGKLALAT